MRLNTASSHHEGVAEELGNPADIEECQAKASRRQHGTSRNHFDKGVATMTEDLEKYFDTCCRPLGDYLMRAVCLSHDIVRTRHRLCPEQRVRNRLRGRHVASSNNSPLLRGCQLCVRPQRIIDWCQRGSRGRNKLMWSKSVNRIIATQTTDGRIFVDGRVTWKSGGGAVGKLKAA